MTDEPFLTVLAVNDEPPALDELAYLLGADRRVFVVVTAGDATEALRVLRDTAVDAVFLDIRMPGLDSRELARVLRRVAAARSAPARPAALPADELTIPVELAGTTKMLPRAAVRWVGAQGDYSRLHTQDASHLVRVSLATLAERWANAGFVRIHRSYLVQIRLVAELRHTHSGYVVTVDETELPVSRRRTRELKDRLVRAAKQDWTR